jgi:hypothetical protein
MSGAAGLFEDYAVIAPAFEVEDAHEVAAARSGSMVRRSSSPAIRTAISSSPPSTVASWC